MLQVEVAIPMYMAAKMAAEEDIRVLFTGQAADELFAGYPWYNEVLAEFGYLRLHEKLWEDLNYLYTDTLEREDKLTMAHSIELKAPYLDRHVIHTVMRFSPKLKLENESDHLRKRVHRQAALELGVPSYLAFRAKAPAQSGSGIHGIIENIAEEETRYVDSRLVDENTRRDKGSLYRYGDQSYGAPAARFYLQEIEEEIKREYIPSLLRQDWHIQGPPRRCTSVLPRSISPREISGPTSPGSRMSSWLAVPPTSSSFQSSSCRATLLSISQKASFTEKCRWPTATPPKTYTIS